MGSIIILLVLLIFGLFVCGAFYVLYKVIMSILNFFFSLNSSEGKISETEKVMVTTFVAMAKLTQNYHYDHDLENQLRSRVKSAFLENGCSANINTIMKEYDRVALETIKVSHLLENLKFLETKESCFKKEFMIDLLSVAYINGNLDENQKKLLDLVKFGIGMTDTLYSKANSEFWTRMKFGKYMNYEEFKQRRAEWYERDFKKKARERKEKESYSRYNYSNSNNKQEERREYKQSSSYSRVSTELEKAYSVLGLSSDASVDDIKKMKRELLKKYHPDLYTSQGEMAVEQATIKSQKINQAYEMIMKNRGL